MGIETEEVAGKVGTLCFPNMHAGPASWLFTWSYSLTCQVRVVRFYVSCRGSSTASSRSQCSSPDPNSKHWIRAFPPGPQQQRISEDIPDRMPERMSEDMPEGMSYGCQIECQCQSIRSYARKNDFQMVCQKLCQNTGSRRGSLKAK